jgi:hypothetical protein
VNVQAAAALGQNGSPMSSGQVFDRIEAAPTAFCDDSFENEKVPFPRSSAVRHSLPRFGGNIVGITALARDDHDAPIFAITMGRRAHHETPQVRFAQDQHVVE